MNAAKLPQTDLIQELANFWDTHDLTDFEDQLEKVLDEIILVKDADAYIVGQKLARQVGIVSGISTPVATA